MPEGDITRIPLESDTRDHLRAEKTGGETYDDVIRRLLSIDSNDE